MQNKAKAFSDVVCRCAQTANIKTVLVNGAYALGDKLRHEESRIYLEKYRKMNPVGMISLLEMCYLHWYAKTVYTGKGAFIDLGSWLGSSVIPSAIGLAENPNSHAASQKIHAFDTFVWEKWMDETDAAKQDALVGKYKKGESIIDEFWQRVSPWKERIEVHQGDLLAGQWNGGPIEFIFVDAMKSWALTNFILNQYFTRLLPGVAYIIHQDFNHYYTSWIPLLMYRLKDYFVPVYAIPHSTSVVYKYRKKMPEHIVQTTFSFASFSPEEIEEAFAYSMTIVPQDEMPRMVAAKAMLFVHTNDLDRAEEELEKARALKLDFDRDLNLVQASIQQKRDKRS